MTRQNTSNIERHYFEQFRRHFTLPHGDVIYGDKPDVRLLGARHIGIEMTQLFITDGSNQSSEQVQSSRRQQVLGRAQALYLQQGGKPIELHIDFDPTCPILDIEDTSVRLARLANEISSQPTRLIGDLSGHAEGLRYVYHNGKECADAKWLNVQLSTVPPVNIEQLESIILKKSKKVSDYKLCDEYWLLVVIDYFNAAQDQDLQFCSDYRIPTNVFERVLLYKPQLSEIVEAPK